MRLRSRFVFACATAAGGWVCAADLPAEKLPPPTPLPEAVPAPPPFRPPTAEAYELPATRDFDTYVFVVNGTDPFGNAELDKLAAKLRMTGYPNMRYGEMFDMGVFEAEMRKIHTEAPHARFVLIGFSAGTYLVRAAANRLLKDDIPVAMIGYIGGDYLTDTEYSRPPGVGRVVNVRGNGFAVTGWNLFWNGSDLKGATNVRLPHVMHFGLPKHRVTFQALYAGLCEVSAGE